MKGTLITAAAISASMLVVGVMVNTTMPLVGAPSMEAEHVAAIMEKAEDRTRAIEEHGEPRTIEQPIYRSRQPLPKTDDDNGDPHELSPGEAPPGGDITMAEPPIEMESEPYRPPVPKNGDDNGIDWKDVYNKMWGLGQALLVAWVVAARQRSKAKKE